MVIETAVLVVGDENDRVFPVWTVTDRIHNLGNMILAYANITAGMFVILGWTVGENSERRVDKGDRGKPTGGCIIEERRQEIEKTRQPWSGFLNQAKVWVNQKIAEADSLWNVGKVIPPRNAMNVQLVKNGAVSGL